MLRQRFLCVGVGFAVCCRSRGVRCGRPCCVPWARRAVQCGRCCCGLWQDWPCSAPGRAPCNALRPAPHALCPPPADVAVEISDGNFSWYNEEGPSLRDVNLSIAKGELVCIVGSTGSGKSNILQAILGEMQQVSGKLAVYGTIGYASQKAWLCKGMWPVRRRRAAIPWGAVPPPRQSPPQCLHCASPCAPQCLPRRLE